MIVTATTFAVGFATRVAVGIALALVLAVSIGVSPAAADPSRPGSDRGSVVRITPDDGRIRARVLGGDSFVELEVARGHDVLVKGYQGEPYLRFGDDGTVQINRAAPTAAQSETRFGSAPDATSSPTGTPRWETVSSDGTCVWHDHRTHWMSPQRPPGAGPGDIVVEGAIPLVVDGGRGEVVIRSVWQEGPPWWPTAVGLAVGAAMAWTLRQTRWALVVFGFAALAVAAIAAVGVPGPARPTDLHWQLPVAASTIGAIRAVRGRLQPATEIVGWVILTLWAGLGIGALWLPVVPTSLPNVERFVIAAVISAAAATAAQAAHAVAGLAGFSRRAVA